MLTTLAQSVAYGLLAYGLCVIFAVALATALPIVGGRVAPAFIWQGVFAWAAAGALRAVARLDAQGGGA